MKKIAFSDLVPMEIFFEDEPIEVDLVYADAGHPENIFGEVLYHPSAKLWAHRDLARIILTTAHLLNNEHGYALVLKDCLRTIDGQQNMGNTTLVRSHPEWTSGETIMVSPPGQGAHPRGMAVDVGVLDSDGHEVDMGTPFDEMDEIAHRSYKNLSPDVLRNRENLEQAFIRAAASLKLPILPIPQEWWDFRFPPDYYEAFAPLSDTDLPPQMRMASPEGPDIPNLPEDHFQRLKEEILGSI